MLNIFQYDFIRNAFIVGTLLSIIIPIIGVIVVLKRLSMIGDALAHSSLAGVSIGLILGFNPIIGAICTCIFSALTVEFIRKKIPGYSEISIAVVLSLGIGLSGLLSGYIKDSVNFNSFLFGSIVTVEEIELRLIIVIGLIVLVSFILLYKELFYITFDERSARLSGVNVNLVNFIFTVLIAFTIAIASRTVGSLIVSSMMVIPVASAMQFARNFKNLIVLSVVYCVVSTISGLFISFYFGQRTGSVIVLINVFLLLLSIFFKGRKQS